MSKVKRYFRKTVISIGGILIILVGIVLLVLPGPGLLAIALGLFVLSWEFEWAQRKLDRFQGELDKILKKVKKD